MKDAFTVAIDGPAAAGKGTLSRAVAAAFDFAHLDTGLLYRAVGARTLEGIDAFIAAQSLGEIVSEDPNLRSPQVTQAASEAAARADVRSALLDFQRAFARRRGGAVLDGRDIGTVVCPHAEVKLFVTASPQIRARRRCDELRTQGHAARYAQVLSDVRARDTLDMQRSAAPLVPAPDAIIIDTTELSIKAAAQMAIAQVRLVYENAAKPET